MASIFPSFMEEIQKQEQSKSTELPMATEIAIDFNTGEPIIENGDFIQVTGDEAIKVWCYFALKIARGRFLAFTNKYGNKIEEELIDKQYNTDVYNKAKRIVEDCLLVNPYIKKIDNLDVSYNGEHRVSLEIEITTVYKKGVIVYG